MSEKINPIQEAMAKHFGCDGEVTAFAPTGKSHEEGDGREDRRRKNPDEIKPGKYDDVE
jgi:hypothetical protein